MVRVAVTHSDICRAGKHAELRVLEASFQRREDRFYSRGDSELSKQQKELDGVLGEIAVIKWLGIPTGPRINVYHDLADVDQDIEVRSSRRDNAPLVIRPNDAFERRFILAIVSDYYVDLIGWTTGYETIKDEYQANPNGAGAAWFVPQSELRQMEVFRK